MSARKPPLHRKRKPKKTGRLRKSDKRKRDFADAYARSVLQMREREVTPDK